MGKRAECKQGETIAGRHWEENRIQDMKKMGMKKKGILGYDVISKISIKLAFQKNILKIFFKKTMPHKQQRSARQPDNNCSFQLKRQFHKPLQQSKPLPEENP